MKTLLFVPANRPEYFEKIARFRPDGVIADLEDAVPTQQKEEARRFLANFGAVLADQKIPLLVRINHLEDYWQRDVDAAIANGAYAIVLPKADSVPQIEVLDRYTGYLEGKYGKEFGSTKFLLIPETATGLRDLPALCAASRRVNGSMTPVSGPVAGDVARAVGYFPSPAGMEQLYVQSKVILDSRASGGVVPFAGIIGMDLNDLDMARTLIERARTMGFGGVALVHPSHVAIAKSVFSVSAESLDEARCLIAAYESAMKAGHGATRYKDAMIDLAMVQRARDVLQSHEDAGKQS
ncbi:HpcH/HpaI aldolase/citrate lyase family protein [Achromobacter spanius]|uniref:HpcH/HpaI aldolase/citrate lyase family protein n=1 Tax=Achromobacter spanius TaxID=217203 RepID=UPI0036E6B276